MPTRSLSQQYKDALSSGNFATAFTVAITYPDGVVRITDYAHDLDHDGYTYQSTGELVANSEVEETNDLSISSLMIEISSLAPGFIAAALLYDHNNRPVTLGRVIVDSDGNVLDLVVLFDGLSSNSRTVDNPDTNTYLLQIEASSEFGDLDQKNGRFTNNASQQDVFSGDKGFEFVDDLADPLIWGRKDRI